MTVDIITIGDELLIGQVVDTNSAYMAKQLNKAGFSVNRAVSIHDSREEILAALDESLKRSNIVLITGGLGPTKDDITKHTLCEYFDTKLVYSEAALENVKRVLKGKVKDLNQLNKDQSLVPESCRVFQNEMGTAPVMWFEKEQRIVVSMPGVPSEMIHILDNEIIPELAQYFVTPHIEHRTYWVHGYPEAILAEFLSDWEEALPESISLAYLPSPGIIRLRMSVSSFDKEEIKRELDSAEKGLTQLIGESIIAYDDKKPQEVIAELLTTRGETLATAESCTGGYIAEQFTAMAGASAYFNGSVVAYSNHVKSKVLQVDPALIEAHGAVSEPVVKAMAKGVLHSTDSDWAIATSGIAGPTGGTPEKPVGTVWVAVGNKDEVHAVCYKFGHVRERNIIRSSNAAMVLLLRFLKM